MGRHGAEHFANYADFAAAHGPLDLYELDRIVRLECRFPSEVSEGCELTIEAHWSRGDSARPLRMIFSGVRGLALPALGGHWFGFSEAELRDVSARGLEGIRLEFVDHGQGGLAFSCRSATLTVTTDPVA